MEERAKEREEELKRKQEEAVQKVGGVCGRCMHVWTLHTLHLDSVTHTVPRPQIRCGRRSVQEQRKRRL